MINKLIQVQIGRFFCGTLIFPISFSALKKFQCWTIIQDSEFHESFSASAVIVVFYVYPLQYIQVFPSDLSTYLHNFIPKVLCQLFQIFVLKYSSRYVLKYAQICIKYVQICDNKIKSNWLLQFLEESLRLGLSESRFYHIRYLLTSTF